MATRTVEEGFNDFLAWITPTPGHSEAVKSHRKSISDTLTANFGMRRFFDTGSFGNDTSIHGHSDVDYFASIPDEKLDNDSNKALVQVRNALDARFPNTGVRVSCPAIRLPFGTDAKETTEVVPAVCLGKTSGYQYYYYIPNCSGKWMKSSPETHNAYVSSVDRRLGFKVKPLIRFLKAWKYYRSVPISSFYLELRVAKWSENESAIIYDMDVRSILHHLASIELAGIQDPTGVSGLIQPCNTDVQYNDALSKLETALSRASNARDASSNNDVASAFKWWNMLYDNKFPSYYK